MGHRVDLKLLGFESERIGPKQELEKAKKSYNEKGMITELVKYTDDTWELYVKK